jgi:hypothetical protein
MIFYSSKVQNQMNINQSFLSVTVALLLLYAKKRIAQIKVNKKIHPANPALLAQVCTAFPTSLATIDVTFILRFVLVL